MSNNPWVNVSLTKPVDPLNPTHQGHWRHQVSSVPETHHDDCLYNPDNLLPSQNYPQEPQYNTGALLGRPASASSWKESEKGPRYDQAHIHRSKRSRIRGWALEVVGLLATLVAFISLLVVLKLVDGQPLSAWHSPFSVNTIVSSLSIAIKAPLAFVVGSCIGQGKWSWFTKRSGSLSGFVTFDDASRGPLGCATLLWWLKSRHWASLGAWVTLLLLLVDPFWQAVIQYDGKLVSTGFNDALVFTSRQLDVGVWDRQTPVEVLPYHGKDDVYQMYSLYPDIGLSATVLIAAVNSSASDLTQPPGTFCRTGNCTWPIYTTLGICNTCFGISDLVLKEEKQGMADESVFSSCHDTSWTSIGNYTSYVLPYSGGRRILIENTNYGVYSVASCELRSRVGLSAAFRPSDTYKFKKSQTLLASFGLLELSADYWNDLTTINKATPKATECALEFCAMAYETQMRDGLPTESIVSRSTGRVAGSYSPSQDLDLETLGHIRNDFGNSLSVDHEAYTLVFKDSTNRDVIVPRHDLQVSLPDNVEIGNSTRIFNVTQKSIITMANNLYQNMTLESITYAISNTTNITQTFDNIARLLTYRMREVDGSQIVGYSEQWVVFTHVRWEFIIFPVIVLLSGYIFATGAVIDSDRLGLRPMKSDTIASLLWGLDSGTRQYLRHEKQHYDCCSDKVKVQLLTEADGLELRAL